MKLLTKISLLAVLLLLPTQVFAGHYDLSETDSGTIQLSSFFDLRDRESFVQVTNSGSGAATLHVQVFNVDDDCNENNFYDNYTGNDTHVYNLRDIQTNDGDPSGVVLPENAYGIVVITSVLGVGLLSVDDNISNRVLLGNFRVLDNNGYEYRTNSAGYDDNQQAEHLLWTFNFNSQSGVILSDIINIVLANVGGGFVEVVNDIIHQYIAYDVDICDLNENAFSCRNVISSCIDQDNPRLEELLETVGESSVASFEWGINEAIPHTKGGELLCPGNTISEGFVRLEYITDGDADSNFGFVGLNNGNGRGSMDAWWGQNNQTPLLDGN